MQALAVRSEARAPAAATEPVADAAQTQTQTLQPPQQYPDYPGFYTPAPRFSGAIDNIAAYGSVIGLGHSLFTIIDQATQHMQ